MCICGLFVIPNFHIVNTRSFCDQQGKCHNERPQQMWLATGWPFCCPFLQTAGHNHHSSGPHLAQGGKQGRGPVDLVPTLSSLTPKDSRHSGLIAQWPPVPSLTPWVLAARPLCLAGLQPDLSDQTNIFWAWQRHSVALAGLAGHSGQTSIWSRCVLP